VGVVVAMRKMEGERKKTEKEIQEEWLLLLWLRRAKEIGRRK
jgi:hypothetical protein